MSSHPSSDAALPADAPPDMVGEPMETQPLGMNDISMLSGLSAHPNEPVIGKLNGIGETRDLVPRDLFARLVTSHQDIVKRFEDFHITAVRFDLCDRQSTGPCLEGADGSIRLVLQTQMPPSFHVEEVGLHAFFSIPAADLASVVNELRAIARISHIAVTGALEVRGFPVEATARLRALLARYARPERLIRLSLLGQDERSSSLRIVFRGVELHDGQFVDQIVATTGATEQVVTGEGLDGLDPSYQVTPVVDSPVGFVTALTAAAFNAAAPVTQRASLDALVATENPQLHTMGSVQCAACHTATYLSVHRAQIASIDLGSMPSRYATTRDVIVTGGNSASQPGSLHAFSWLSFDTEISHRVANETAKVLDEIERRFPVPHS
ncbi:MAG TPA: hypothetical protein VFK02_00340 [Kofleriaceae bacterium]|nr:hypothetical protein [Kofleriaceae bacterium]